MYDFIYGLIDLTSNKPCSNDRILNNSKLIDKNHKTMIEKEKQNITKKEKRETNNNRTCKLLNVDGTLNQYVRAADLKVLCLKNQMHFLWFLWFVFFESLF